MMYLVPRFKAPHLIAPGMFLTSLGSLLYAVKPEHTNYWAVEFPANICMPWGIDLYVHFTPLSPEGKLPACLDKALISTGLIRGPRADVLGQ